MVKNLHPALSNETVQRAAPRDRAWKLADRLGLYVAILPSGTKSWRLKYHFEGKEKSLALGVFPSVGLTEARERRDMARELLADRLDPSHTVNGALRRLGYDRDTMTGHGFRAMARTILDEVLNVPPAIIEAQLAHAVKDPLGRAYNRTAHLPQRREMMQQWADYLDQLKASAQVIPFAFSAGSLKKNQ